MQQTTEHFFDAYIPPCQKAQLQICYETTPPFLILLKHPAVNRARVPALSSISVESGLKGAPVHKSSSSMHRFCCEQEAAQDLLAVFGVAAAGETAQITPQVFEPAFAQVGRA